MTTNPPLLNGTYAAPNLRRGDLEHCHVRDCQMRVTGWSGGHIPWPKGCIPKKSPGSPGIIVDEELARAVMHESAVAVRYWWGVSNVAVIKWRKALGVTRKNNEGTHALVCAAMEKAKAAQNPVRSEEYRERQRQHTLRRRPWEKNPPSPPEKPWTAEQLALLGTMTDGQVDKRIDRSRVAVKTKRRKLGIAPRPKGGAAMTEGGVLPRRLHGLSRRHYRAPSRPAPRRRGSRSMTRWARDTGGWPGDPRYCDC